MKIKIITWMWLGFLVMFLATFIGGIISSAFGWYMLRITGVYFIAAIVISTIVKVVKK